ncbi:MAG: YmdB family metallophosphoesterase [Candidatus Omnitrophica bacterium]|nr:YmdB family metallophosphoesterase [Candidatus Omnitrophota bacterium]MCG2700558.1 YmdB family metallophosphoesterase [Candidatus Parcubacteria bacterium]
MKVLFIGDICGKIGRKAVAKILPELKKELKPDLVVANVENLAHGKGVTKTTLDEVFEAGVDWATGGDHSFSNHKQAEEIYNGDLPILRPANYSAGVPGKGCSLIKLGDKKILLINLIGRVFMRMDYDCPFRKLDEILADYAAENLSAIIIDIHAEATSEKIIMSYFADGRASAVLGTHSHVMTADHGITSQGTARITDVGMAGSAEGSLGIAKEDIIKTFLTQIKYPHIIPEKGKAIFNAVLVSIDPKTAKAKSIKPITKFVEIE